VALQVVAMAEMLGAGPQIIVLPTQMRLQTQAVQLQQLELAVAVEGPKLLAVHPH